MILVWWDLREIPHASNLKMGGGNNLFRLNAHYKPPNSDIVGGEKNLDLSPDEDRDVILRLLRLAERIFDPPG